MHRKCYFSTFGLYILYHIWIHRLRYLVKVHGGISTVREYFHISLKGGCVMYFVLSTFQPSLVIGVTVLVYLLCDFLTFCHLVA